MDSSSWKAYGKIDPELEALLPHLPPSKSFADYKDANDLRRSIDQQIQQMIEAGVLKPADFTGVKKEDIQVPTRDGSSIRAVHYYPESGSAGPLLVYFHGGGFVFGMPEAYETGFSILTKELGFTVVSVDYRMAPEYVFPTAAHDAIDSLIWSAQNASKLRADPSQGFIVSGTSAGGLLAAVASHAVVDEKISPPLTGVFLSVPGLVHEAAVPEKYKPHYNSMEEHKDAMILDRRGLRWLFDTYKMVPEDPLASPLLWPSGHKSQPPTYFQLCGMDPLRDEALIYEYHLREECGVPTRLDVATGIPHAGTDFMPMLSAAGKAMRDLKAGMEWLLHQKS